MKRILFVCTGNICRSPTAEAVARYLIASNGLGESVEVDSAGTHDYHVGEAPDPRTVKAAARRGYDLSSLRARSLEEDDFQRFDIIVALDHSHLDSMHRRCPAVYRPKLVLLTDYARTPGGRGVPDPYYGGEAGFDAVLDMCEDAVEGLLEAVLRAPSRGRAGVADV